MRNVRWLGIALGASALAASAIVPAVTASASTANHGIWNYSWKPGTALPKIGAGEKLVAWPVPAVLATIKVDQMVPMVTIGRTSAQGAFTDTASSTAVRSVTADGVVNLMAEPDICTEPQYVKNLGKKWTTIGTAFSLIRSASLHFVYTRSQETTLEVGESASGTSGVGWSADGTISISGGSSSANDFGTQKGVYHERYYTEFRYGKFKVSCGPSGHGTPRAPEKIEHYYEIRAIEYAAGVRYQHPKVPKFKGYNCVTYQPNPPSGNGLTVNYSSAITFSSGFSVYGFTGSAHTGYDTNASITVWFYDGGRLCGTNDVPGGTPKVLIGEKL
jgi:hypothetical protein